MTSIESQKTNILQTRRTTKVRLFLTLFNYYYVIYFATSILFVFDLSSTFLAGGKLRVNEEFNEVWKESQQIKLSDLEYRMLKLLMSRRNKIFSAQNIYESVWRQPYFYCSNNTVMVHIRKLRAKIEDDPARPVFWNIKM